MDNLKERIIALIYANQKLSAIKLVRETSGMDLKAAKDYVEQIEQELLKTDINLIRLRELKEVYSTLDSLLYQSHNWDETNRLMNRLKNHKDNIYKAIYL